MTEHAEEMAKFLVEVIPYLSTRKADEARRLVKVYRGDQRSAVAKVRARAQGSMFEESHDIATIPYQPTATSIDAAGSIVHLATKLRERVYQAILSKPDTDEGIGIRLSMEGNTVRPRRCELVKAGRVVESGETRKTKSGRSAVVWEARP